MPALLLVACTACEPAPPLEDTLRERAVEGDAEAATWLLAAPELGHAGPGTNSARPTTARSMTAITMIS